MRSPLSSIGSIESISPDETFFPSVVCGIHGATGRGSRRLRGLSDEPDLFERGEFSLVCVVEK